MNAARDIAHGLRLALRHGWWPTVAVLVLYDLARHAY